jgi:oxygen-independent coproporphyrinogen-3 oxidase
MPAVYFSYPFCAQKCTFCNFASSVYSQAHQRRYDAALVKELQNHDWTWDPQTVYWGGGTPSLMPLDCFVDLMSRVPRHRLTETTMECAPGTIDPQKVAVWRECGVNRVSLGVQSFVSDELHRTGRRHTAEVVEHDIQMLRQAGIENVNIDLIAGLPGQTLSSWRLSLDFIAQLDPPHVSVYLFEIDEDSSLGREALTGGARYGAALLPSEDAMADMYEQAVEFLAGIGLRRYEISNFARPGSESMHNLKYWRLEPYVGFGLDAHSFDRNMRWGNHDDLETYLRCIESGENPRMTYEPADHEQEHFFVGLREISGIKPTAHEWQRFAAPIERALESGLLVNEGCVLRLTNQGVLLSNEVLQEFVNV